MTADPLLVDLLNAAGYDLRRVDAEQWVAVHRDTKQEVRGEYPGDTARLALHVLRAELTSLRVRDAHHTGMAAVVDALTVDLTEALVDLAQARRDLAEARELLPDGEQWCEACGRYEDDYVCGCPRCQECGRKMTPASRDASVRQLSEVLCFRCRVAELRRLTPHPRAQLGDGGRRRRVGGAAVRTKPSREV